MDGATLLVTVTEAVEFTEPLAALIVVVSVFCPAVKVAVGLRPPLGVSVPEPLTIDHLNAGWGFMTLPTWS